MDTPKRICPFFKENLCTLGSQCRLSHVEPTNSQDMPMKDTEKTKLMNGVKETSNTYISPRNVLKMNNQGLGKNDTTKYNMLSNENSFKMITAIGAGGQGRNPMKHTPVVPMPVSNSAKDPTFVQHDKQNTSQLYYNGTPVKVIRAKTTASFSSSPPSINARLDASKSNDQMNVPTDCTIDSSMMKIRSSTKIHTPLRRPGTLDKYYCHECSEDIPFLISSNKCPNCKSCFVEDRKTVERVAKPMNSIQNDSTPNSSTTEDSFQRDPKLEDKQFLFDKNGKKKSFYCYRCQEISSNVTIRKGSVDIEICCERCGSSFVDEREIPSHPNGSTCAENLSITPTPLPSLEDIECLLKKSSDRNIKDHGNLELPAKANNCAASRERELLFDEDGKKKQFYCYTCEKMIPDVNVNHETDDVEISCTICGGCFLIGSSRLKKQNANEMHDPITPCMQKSWQMKKKTTQKGTTRLNNRSANVATSVGATNGSLESLFETLDMKSQKEMYTNARLKILSAPIESWNSLNSYNYLDGRIPISHDDNQSRYQSTESKTKSQVDGKGDASYNISPPSDQQKRSKVQHTLLNQNQQNELESEAPAEQLYVDKLSKAQKKRLRRRAKIEELKTRAKEQNILKALSDKSEADKKRVQKDNEEKAKKEQEKLLEYNKKCSMERFFEEMQVMYPARSDARQESNINSRGNRPNTKPNALEMAKEAFQAKNTKEALHILCNALKEYDTTAKTDDKDYTYKLLTYRAIVSQQLGNVKDTINDATKAISLNDAAPGAYTIRAKAFYSLNDESKAFSDFIRAMNVEPGMSTQAQDTLV